MPRDRLLTTGELATYLSCSRSTVRRLTARGELPHYRLGRMVRFRRGEVDLWLARCRAGPAPGLVRDCPPDPDQLSLFG
ncbi:MAG: helix-turn-helix domain-containing protein [Candidatus Latescibacterota bacterium]